MESIPEILFVSFSGFSGVVVAGFSPVFAGFMTISPLFVVVVPGLETIGFSPVTFLIILV